MSFKKISLVLLTLFSGVFIYQCKQHSLANTAKVCVFQTVFGEQPIDTSLIYPPSQEVLHSLDNALKWLASMQLADGGWSSASGASPSQNSSRIKSDPATTAVAAMAFLRHGSTPDSGPYQKELAKATDYLIQVVRSTPPDNSNLISGRQTQIQRKLGNNIDLILASQFLSNMLQVLDESHPLYQAIVIDLDKCIDKLQQMQDANGSFKAAGWAGVLQSALANNALEVAQHKGAWVSDEILEQSRKYQKGNYDLNTGSIATRDGAGVLLYAVSSSVRASAKEAKLAIHIIETGIENKILKEGSLVSQENMMRCGVESSQALKLHTAWHIYQSAKKKAQQSEVTTGYGNNGGEEYISHLQIGESLLIAHDEEWKTWFDRISAQLMSAQQTEGYWQGHHCITSPVYCTATCILILSINEDVDELMELAD